MTRCSQRKAQIFITDYQNRKIVPTIIMNGFEDFSIEEIGMIVAMLSKMQYTFSNERSIILNQINPIPLEDK